MSMIGRCAVPAGPAVGMAAGDLPVARAAAPVTATAAAAPGKAAAYGVQAHIAAAAKDGFKIVSIGNAPATPLVEMQFTKDGKTRQGFGLLGDEWDEKKTAALKFLRTTEGLSWSTASKQVLVKPRGRVPVQGRPG